LAKEFELMSDTKAGAVIGSTADVGTGQSMQSWLKRTEYKAVGGATASTWLLSTAAVIDSITVVPISSAAGTVTLADGTTNLFVIPTVAHVPQPSPFTLDLGGIRNTAAAGFKIITGTSVYCVVKGAFVGTPTTA